jgi:hypothetical protein
LGRSGDEKSDRWVGLTERYGVFILLFCIVFFLMCRISIEGCESGVLQPIRIVGAVFCVINPRSPPSRSLPITQHICVSYKSASTHSNTRQIILPEDKPHTTPSRKHLESIILCQQCLLVVEKKKIDWAFIPLWCSTNWNSPEQRTTITHQAMESHQSFREVSSKNLSKNLNSFHCILKKSIHQLL